MAFFNRFLSSVTGKKESTTPTAYTTDSSSLEATIWKEHFQTMPENCKDCNSFIKINLNCYLGSVRVVLFRECERKGKKLLFDSSTVERHRLSGNAELDTKEMYTEVGDEWGYKYLQPPAKDVRLLSEMIFGGAAVTHPSPNMKLHHVDAASLMWSSVLQAPHPARGIKASDQSLGSSFGCSFGSFNVNDSNNDIFGASPIIPPPQGVLQQVPSLAASDSGFYSSYTAGSVQNSYNSFATVDSDADLEVGGKGIITGNRAGRRRLSSNADMPDYGSWCSLQRRWMSMVENSLTPTEFSQSQSHANITNPHFGSSPGTRTGSLSNTENLNPKATGRSNAVLGLAIIIQTPDSSSQNIFLKQNLVIEDIFNQLFQSVKQAYIHKKRFVSTVYAGYKECLRCIQQLYTIPQVQSSAWHMVLGTNNSIAIQDKLVHDIVNLRNQLDTKESNFFFSSLLTGILSHHLGWVETVMPSSSFGLGENSLNKPGSAVVEQFSQLHWYSPTRVQFKEMHGMVGCPARNVKTLILADEEELARKLVFVLSYFIRCSQIFERELKFEDSDSVSSFKYRINKNDMVKSRPLQECSSTSKIVIMAKSNSSPTMEPKIPKQSMKKSKSFICSLSDIDQNELETKQQTPNEKVNFLIGENENLNLNAEFAEECFDSNLDGTDDLETDFKSISIITPKDGVVITKGVSVTMKAEDEDQDDFIEITEVPLTPFEITSSKPAILPSLICCSDQYMPGTLLQGCFNQDGEGWRSNLQSDLLATANNHFVSGSADESICVVGDSSKMEVSLVSAQQIVVGRPGLPVPLSPMVANMLDTFVTTASFNLPANVVLNQLEDNLQQLYLQSCILAEFLLSADDFLNLQTISAVLDVDPCDVPLLLSVAATHTPSVGHKYGLSFAA